MINQISQFIKHPLVALCIRILATPVGLVHEMAHYLPARIFGMHPKLHWDSIEHDPAPLPQLIVVTLTPSLFGMLLACVGALLYPHTMFASLVIYVGVGVFASSPIDWRDAFYMFRQWRQKP